MSDLTEKNLETTTIFSGKILTLREDKVLLPNGKVTAREVVAHPGAVAIVPVLADRIIMVEQFRYPVSQTLLEIPAGKLDPGETPEQCAIRELAEETGYIAAKLQKLAAIFTAPGFTDETIHIYKAENLTVGQQKTDEDEFIKIHFHSPADIAEMISSGKISDAKTIVGLALAGVCRAELL